MKIEMVNNNKLKIMFDYIELEENNISLHSFLSNSIETQKFFLAILDIANEDLGFNKSNSNLSYETISFDNKFFVVIITKAASSSKSYILKSTNNHIFESSNSKNNHISENSNLNSKSENFNTNNQSKNFNVNNQNEFLYKLRDVKDLFNFCDDLKKFLPVLNFDSSLYQYNDAYFLKIIFENTKNSEKVKTILLISEFKNNLNLSELALNRFNEFSELIIAHNAVQVL